MSPGLEGTKIPSAVTVVDLKQHFPSIESAAAVRVLGRRLKCFAQGWSPCTRKLTFPGGVLKALWNTGLAASLSFPFGSSSKIRANLI